MRVETTLPLDDLRALPTAVRRAEALGFDGVTVPETAHNPFMALALAAEHSTRLRLATSVAQAFVRSPTTTAYAAFDLQRLSGGRLYLGLGSQVKGQIERRFGMPWTAPAPRMKDYIRAMRAVWSCWQDGSQLNYQGTHYRLNVMTPNHRPRPLPQGLPMPAVGIAAVLPYMTRLAGELCDGVRLHGFNTEKYVHNVALPNLRKGADRAGRSLDGFDIAGGGMIATGATEEEVAKAVEQTRWSIAFYGSTRTYTVVWEQHGWEAVGRRLHELSVTNGWAEMPKLITDEMVHTFAAVGTYEQIGDKILDRFGSFATTVGLPLPAPEHEKLLLPSIRRLQEAGTPTLGSPSSTRP
jgi:probable F420-dependent oxidoreductase